MKDCNQCKYKQRRDDFNVRGRVYFKCLLPENNNKTITQYVLDKKEYKKCKLKANDKQGG
jgi:hypothetical protein